MFGDEVGLFWEEEIKVKEPKTPIIKEPVVLKPYQARTPLQYCPMTEDELVRYKGDHLIFDTETFRNLFLIAFKHIKTGHVLTLTMPFDTNMLDWILRNYIVIGFNSFKYDLPLAWASVYHQDGQKLKYLSNDLIQGMWRDEASRQYRFELPHTKQIDLIEVCPLRGSLKLYAARLHSKRILDLPWVDQQTLEDWQVPITIDYCINDLDNTQMLFENLTEQLALRQSLSEEYLQDVMSKSDAQIAEVVIGAELRKIRGRSVPRPSFRPGKIYKYKAPPNLVFKTQYMRDVLQQVENAEFKIDYRGYIIRPDEINNFKVNIGNATYRMGIGGLHSSESNVAHLADDDHLLVDRDVAGYYPSITIQTNLYPNHLGPDFLKVYKKLVARRLEAKRNKNMAVSENLKVTVNGTFGKTGSPHSILYAPEVIIQILLSGQLYLLMIIESLELAGIEVVSANTDGFLMRCPRQLETAMLAIIREWEQTTGFETEETRYQAVYARDVNAYLAIKQDGSVKGKNIFYDPWRQGSNEKDKYWRFQKNPTCQICVEAVEKHITKGTPLRATVEACNDITRFVAIKNVTGGAHWDGHYLGKVVRWYYAKDVKGTINYINSNRIVGDTEGAKPLMDLPDNFPDDIDLDRYVKRCEDMLKEMGYAK